MFTSVDRQQRAFGSFRALFPSLREGFGGEDGEFFDEGFGLGFFL
jgi:hypothetical protein